MEYLNIHCTVIESPEFKRSEPVDRATWLCLLHYCAKQENGGVLADCVNWSDREWIEVCGVTLAEVSRPSRLWRWMGESLEVFGYPHKQEQVVQQKRELAINASRKRWRDSASHPTPYPIPDKESNPIPDQSPDAMGSDTESDTDAENVRDRINDRKQDRNAKRKGKEWKGMEGKERGNTSVRSTSASVEDDVPSSGLTRASRLIGPDNPNHPMASLDVILGARGFAPRSSHDEDAEAERKRELIRKQAEASRG